MKKLILAVLLVGAAACAFGEAFTDVVISGSPAKVRAELESGARATEGDPEYGLTPLMWAAANNGNPEVIALLVAAGASVNGRSRAGTTPLMWAAEYNDNPDVLKALLDEGADADALDPLGMSPLILAARHNTRNPWIITALLMGGARIDGRDSGGMTALMWAARVNPNPDMLTALLDAGADGTLASDEGKTAFDYAKGNPMIKGTRAYRALSDSRF